MDRKSYKQELKALNHPLYKGIESFLIKNWRVILFTLCCFIVYERSIQDYSGQTAYLANKLTSLEKEKNLLLKEQETLQLQINSQSDPKWIELTLIKVLGVVPEGQKKVYFQKRAEQ
jgi:hypothetical protein